MPKKKAHQFGHGQKKSKKKTKYNSKPTPAEEPKKDEEDTIEVDVRGDPGDSSTGTPSEFQLSSANMTNPVAAVDKSSGERHVQPADAFASCNDPPKGQDAPTIVSRGSPVHFTAERQPDGASVSPNMSEDSERHPGSGEALVPLVTPVPKPAFSHPPPAFPLPPWLRGPSMPGFALNAASRAPFRQPPPPLPTVVASRTFTPTTARAVEGWHEKAAPLRPSRAIEQEDVEPAASHEPPSPECVIKHPLANKWTLWWFCPDPSTGTSDWESCQKLVLTISTVEDFWALYHHIQPASELKNGYDYSFFKEGIRPMWEHKRNCAGGRWLYAIDWKRAGLPKRDPFRVDKCWLEALLLLIGEDYGDETMRGMVNGVVINLRKMDKLAVWMDNVDASKDICGFGHYFQRAISAPPNTLIFEAHQDTMAKRGSTGRATYRI